MNTVTTLANDLPISFDHGARFRSCEVLLCNFDTLASALTVFTPDSDKLWGIAGILYSHTAAHNLTFTSGSTDIVTLPMNAGGLAKGVGVGDGILVSGLAIGDALKLTIGTALVAQILLYVVQFKPTG